MGMNISGRDGYRMAETPDIMMSEHTFIQFTASLACKDASACFGEYYVVFLIYILKLPWNFFYVVCSLSCSGSQSGVVGVREEMWRLKTGVFMCLYIQRCPVLMCLCV